ncbi:VanZ family protein [Desulfonatronum thioautotrophicum]|uniref:VanZ family protein n=1 Tax=Desulfonatronum thioautotrophicum TaxID=617001 RepID=UPI0009FBF35A|nr:VanZ family protein [Desulfonatronum thioautotrophicum]
MPPRSSYSTTLRNIVRDRHLSAVVPLGYMALMLIMASVPGDGQTAPDQRHALWFLQLLAPAIQNLLHIPAYGLLAFFWRWTLRRYIQGLQTAAILAFGLAVGFGVFQEWFQSMIPGRFASLSDVLFNTIGAALGVWVYHRWFRRL